MAGLYIHVPFCEKRCHYCDFNTYLLRAGGVEEVLAALEGELDLYAPLLEEQGVAFGTVFIGGGTPTALASGQLDRLLRSLRRRMPIEPKAEITVEANPGTLSARKLHALLAGGVNRLSLGVQTLSDVLLSRLGRIHDAAQARESFFLARREGFANVNVDLMFGLPGQTAADWEDTLRRVVTWQPDHLSCYSLIIEEGTPFGEWHKSGRLPLPGEDAELAMYLHAISALTAAGYRRYEISNFARPGMECRHNQIYWENGEWLGLGPGAHSQWRGERFANLRLPAEYVQAVREGRTPVEWREAVARRTDMEDTLILGLRLAEGVSRETFRRRFGVDVQEVFGKEIARLQTLGLLADDGDALRLTAQGLPVANQVFVSLLA